MADERCGRCMGEGWLTSWEDRVRCPECGGEGVLPNPPAPQRPEPEADGLSELAAFWKSEYAKAVDILDRATNALTDSIMASGNDARTNMHWVNKMRRGLEELRGSAPPPVAAQPDPFCPHHGPARASDHAPAGCTCPPAPAALPDAAKVLAAFSALEDAVAANNRGASVALEYTKLRGRILAMHTALAQRVAELEAERDEARGQLALISGWLANEERLDPITREIVLRGTASTFNENMQGAQQAALRFIELCTGMKRPTDA